MDHGGCPSSNRCDEVQMGSVRPRGQRSGTHRLQPSGGRAQPRGLAMQGATIPRTTGVLSAGSSALPPRPNNTQKPSASKIFLITR